MTAPEIPDFNLIRPVGSGGFGQVWLAANRTTGRLRAVKVISLRQSGQDSPAAREICSLTRLEANLRCRHPNLLQIDHVGKTAGHLFYVMDLADDMSGDSASDNPNYRPATLQSRLQGGEKGTGPICRDQPLVGARPPGAAHKLDLSPFPRPPDICLDYARQLLAGLASLHAAGMVHRDVKPANCLFVGGQLKLADFGLLTEAHPLVSRVGTRKYMPPDGRMDMRADVYAAGLVIYEMLTGRTVDDFPRLGHRAGEIVADQTLARLLALVLRACEREPERRFADARPMLAELDKPIQSRHRSPRRRMFIAACAAVLAGVGWSAWMSVSNRVAVSFITDPFEAKVYLDDHLQVDAEGMPYRTPCTIDDLPSGTHRVAFEQGGVRWEDGEHDFAKMRQIVSWRTQ